MEYPSIQKALDFGWVHDGLKCQNHIYIKNYKEYFLYYKILISLIFIKTIYVASKILKTRTSSYTDTVEMPTFIITIIKLNNY